MEHVSWWNSNQSSSNSILIFPVCMLEWAATSKEKPCHLACQSFRNFLDLGLKSTNHHKHSWSRWLPWRLLNLRPMCLDWQKQVNVRLLADTDAKIMKLNQEEMCRLHSRVKSKTMYDIGICKSFLSCIRVIKLWFLMPSYSYFWGLQCSPKLMDAVSLDSNCASHETWDDPWCTSEILTPWHLRTSASWCPWSSMLFIRTKRSFFENCYSEASTCGIATARRWQAFRIFRKWLTNLLHTNSAFPLIFWCRISNASDALDKIQFQEIRLECVGFAWLSFWTHISDRLHRIRPSSMPSPTFASKSHLQIWIWQCEGIWFWMFKFPCWILSHFSFHGHAMFYLFAAEDGRRRRRACHALRVQKQLRWHQTRMFEAEGLKRRRGD